MNETIEYYKDLIENAETLEDLDEIMECAANDDLITHKEYTQVYEMAYQAGLEM